jgi:hypothetical protein
VVALLAAMKVRKGQLPREPAQEGRRMKRAELILSGIAALLAVVANCFWFASAVGEVPQMITYLGHTPENDPFFQSLQFSVRNEQVGRFV